MGIAHNERDKYFYILIESVVAELRKKGIATDTNDYEDIILIADTALWRYRHRSDGAPLAQNIENRIRNRKMKRRAYFENT